MSKKTGADNGLNVVRGAGFKKHRRKQPGMSENTRAGLRADKHSSKAELVKRKRPLALKHKRRIRKAVVALSAVFIAALSLFGYGFFVGSEEVPGAVGIYESLYLQTDSAVTPNSLMGNTHGNADGSNEEDEGWKTLGYLNYTLRNQPYYYSYMTSDIAISIGGMMQHVETEKQYYDHVLVSSEITTTPKPFMGVKIESATQFAVIENSEVVMWRSSVSSNPSTFHGKETEWSTGRPQGATWEEYRKTRGNLQNEFSVYVLNRDTLLSWTGITRNDDGSYSQSFVLNHEAEPEERSAIYYYQQQMKASGGLPSLPTFHSVEVKYTFDDKWQVLRSDIKELYTANYGPIKADGTSTSVTEYYYEEEKAKNTFYSDYFQGYESDFGTPVESELTVTECLSSAFGSVLTGEAKLAVDLDIDGRPLSGIVHLNLGEQDVRAEIGNIKVYLRSGSSGQELYISFGDNTKIKLPLSDITGGGEAVAVSEEEEGGNASGGLDTDALMEQLMGGDFTVSEDKSSAVLSSVIELFGIKIPLTFNFAIDGGSISLADLRASLSLLGSEISAKVRFTEESVPQLTPSEAEEYVPLDIGSFKGLASAEALDVYISYDGNGVSVSGEATVNLGEFALKADLKLILGGDVQAEKDVTVIYKDGEIYLSLGSAGEEPAKFKAGVDGLTELVSELTGADGAETDAAAVLEQLLSAVEKIGLGNILGALLCDRDFANNISVTSENGFTLTVNGTELVKYFGGSFELGDIILSVDGETVTLSLLGISGEVTPGKAFAFDESEYLSANDILPIVGKVKDIISQKGLSVNGTLALTIKGTRVVLDIKRLSLNWDGGIAFGLNAELRFGGFSQKITASYDGEQAKVSYGNVGITLDKSQFGELAEAVIELITASTGKQIALPEINGDGEILALLQTGQLDIFGIINSLDISGIDGGMIIRFGGLNVTLLDEAETELGLLGVGLSWQSGDISVALEDAHITEYCAPEAPDHEIGYFNGAELIPLINKVTSILQNGGLNISGSVKLTLGGKELNIGITNASISWKDGIAVTAAIKVTYGELVKDISVHYGADGIKLWYDGIGVTLEQKDIDGFITAVQALYAEIANIVNKDKDKIPEQLDAETLKGLIPAGDSKLDIAAILKNLKLTKNEAGNLTVGYGDITAELINKDGEFSANVKYKDTVTASIAVAEYSEVTMPEGEYFNGAELTPLINKVTAILQKDGLNISGNIAITTASGNIGVDISELSISWKNGSLTFGLSATLTLNDKGHKIYAEYDGATLSVVYDNIGLTLEKSSFTGFAAAAQKLYNAIAAEANLPKLQEATLQGIIDMFKTQKSADGEDQKTGDKSTSDIIVGILKALTITNNAGNLNVGYGGLGLELYNETPDGVLGVKLSYATENLTVACDRLHIGLYDGGKSVLPAETEVKYFSAADLMPLMEHVTEIINNHGLTIGGTLNILTGSTQIDVTVYGLSLGWSDGISLKLDMRVTVNGSDHDIYAEYSSASGELVFVYGKLESGVGAKINVKEDVATFENALVALYNRIAEVINTIVESKPMAPAEDLQGVYDGLTPVLNSVLDIVKTLQSVSDGINDLTGKIDEIQSATPDIFSIINSFEYSPASGKFTLLYGGMTISLWNGGHGLSLGVQTGSVGIELNDLTIIADSAIDFGIEPENLLGADDLCELIDYVAAAVEMLAKDTFSISLEGKVTTTDEAYAGADYIKYNVDAKFEYIQGSEYPVHIETGADGGEPNFWISPDMYAHVEVNLRSTIIDVDSVLFDIYILDGNPEIDGAGLTAGEFTKDDELDVYMSISRIPKELNDKDGANHTKPVRIYAPVSEIMTIASAGVAMADLHSISTEVEALNELIQKVADLLDTLLVDKYLTYTKDQFSSLGSSLLEQILGGKVSDIVNKFISSLSGESAETAPGAAEPHIDKTEEPVEYGKFDRERKGALARFAVTPTKDENGKTTKTAFEVQIENGADATVTKENYTYTHAYKDADGAEQSEEREGTRITGVTVHNSALNATDTLRELTVGVGYTDVERPTALTGYMSFVGVDNLLQAVVNSATHATGTDDDGVSTYDLNKNFYITGSLGVSALGLVNHQITIDGLSVSLDGNNQIEVNLRLSYKGMAGLVNGASTVDLTIKNGMVYLKRVQTSKFGGFLGLQEDSITPITTYRVMPLDTFMTDIMNQLVFILNFGDTIANQMTKDSTGNENTESTIGYKQDYGEQLGDYLHSFITAQNEAGTATWTATLSNKGINRLAGMTNLLSDNATVTLNGAKEEVTDEAGALLFDKYTIKSLDLNAKLFGLLTVSGNLVWHNPCNIYDGDSEAAKNALESSAPSIKAEEWLGVSGAYTFEDIKANVEWDKLATAINTTQTADPVNPEFSTDTASYLEVIFNGDENNYDNIDSHARLGKYGYYLNDGGEEKLLKEEVVWFTNDNSEICSKNISAPDLSGYAKAHYSLVWGDRTRSGSTFRQVAAYVPEKYNVSIHSEHYMPNYDSGDMEYVYEYVHTYGDLLDFDMSYEIRGNAEDKWYRIAYLEYNGVRYYKEDIASLVIGADADITIVWEEILHATVTVESEHEIAGFESAGGKWQKTFEIETGTYVNLKELVGYIADTAEGYTFGGFTLNEGDEETSDIVNISGDTTIYVKWIEPEIAVNYYSSLNVAGYEQTVKEGYSSVYTTSATYNMSSGFGVITPEYSGYEFLGWFYNDGENWIKITDVKNDIEGSDKYSTAVELHALWYTYEMEDFTVQHTTTGFLGTTHHYDFSSVTVNAALYGNIGLLKQLSFSTVNIYTIAKKNTDYETNTSSHPWSGDESKGVFSQTTNLIEVDNKFEMTATFDANSYEPGGKKNNVVAVAEFTVQLGGNIIIEHKQSNNEIKKEGSIN